MIHRSTADVVRDLEQSGMLVRISEEVDPDLEMAALHRRVHALGGPALYFERVKGSPFPAASNLYGTMERACHLFQHSLRTAQLLVQAKADPVSILRSPTLWRSVLGGAWNAWPRRVSTAPVLARQTVLSALPAPRCWPMDGGRFITLPQVCTSDVHKPGILGTNVGMYRVQLSGNQYLPDQEAGLHYQIHRGIGIHQSRARAKGVPLKVAIWVGGPPAHAFAAVMPLPEGLPEVAFAGVLAGSPFRYLERDGWTISADADFCILGTVQDSLKPEGPFGDHLGYYSNAHPFPSLHIERVYHRPGAIWPFTVVGRPPQEDSVFGALIHEITAPMTPVSVHGLRQLHAVDAAGVHPLTLAVGSERYLPYAREQEPMELLTTAYALLGFNQVSLTKYLFIAAGGIPGEQEPDVHDIPAFFQHVLERVDLTRDLHFSTRTTMDTLDYSGSSLNHGSKLIVAACGQIRRSLGTAIPSLTGAEGITSVRLVFPGILAVSGLPWSSRQSATRTVDALCASLQAMPERAQFPLVVLCDDAEFVSRSLDNFLWVTFTRSDPGPDLHGAGAFLQDKHWGCEGPLVLDARSKPHHAAVLQEDPDVERRVDRFFSTGGSLHGKVRS